MPMKAIKGRVREFYSRLTYDGVKLPARPPVSEKADFFWTAAYSRDHERATSQRLVASQMWSPSARTVEQMPWKGQSLTRPAWSLGQ